jgi:hypothetical protein
MAHRTALIAAGSIAVVIVAGTIAVGANLGILNAADSHPVGKLSASTSIPATQTTPAAVAEPVVAAAAVPQQYVIKKAGSVSVTLDKSGLRLSDVTPVRGWTWALAQTRDSKLTVTFKRKSATYTFVAVRGPHDSIVARVDHPITKVIAARAPAAPTIIASTIAPAAAPAPASTPRASHGGDNGGGGGDHSDD